MEYLEIFLVFFKLGIVNFGGGYALFPLLEREFVTKRKWTTNQELTDYYAVGQCTPGAFAVNISTFIGIKRKGVLGGIIATLGFIFPAFIIIFIIASLLTSFASNEYVLNALAGIRVCVLFLIIYAISKLVKTSIKDIISLILAISIAILAIAIKEIPLYCYVIFAAAFGLLVSFIKEKKNKDKKEIKKEKIIKDKEVRKEERIKRIKTFLISLSGFLVGLSLGLIGVISFLFIKNKKYRKGVLSSIILWLLLVFCILVKIFLQSGLGFEAFFQFFKIGFLAFGGGLATIPFLNELALTTDWFTLIDLANMLAVSESTPGAMGINMSTYVGYTLFHNNFNNFPLAFLGSMVTTLGLVSPSVIVIFLISLFLQKFKNNKYVEWVFYGLRAASIGLILAAVYSVLRVSLLHQYVEEMDGVIKSVSTIPYAFNMAFSNVNSFTSFFLAIWDFIRLSINFKALG
ncbi:MAG: chromate transporter, partial [Acholeplasmatales bacterium]|nr:chromate transporter [Acholeplasmatales bacterium]